MKHDFIKLFKSLSGKETDLIILILTSQNIKTLVQGQNNRFDIYVTKKDMEMALLMVETFHEENKFSRIKQQFQKIPVSSFNSTTAFIIMGILFLIHMLCIHYHIQNKMIMTYGASSLFILQGETYRAVTALLLHSDARHLAGNLAGLLIFGAPFISLAGFGVGPFMLLFAGTLGNLINAHFYKTAHLSIGASTAIMGAAGLLVAFQVTCKQKPFRLNNIMPVFAGMVLVAMFSQGERTDVWAHIFGFICGLVPGIIFFPLNRTVTFAQKDTIFCILTIVILLSSLLPAFYSTIHFPG